MTKSEIIRFLILRSIGNFLVLFALFGVGATFGPALYYEAHFRIAQARGIRYVVASPASSNIPNTSNTPNFPNSNERVLLPKDTDFSIVIPKIGASAKIFPNVDPSNENDFVPILQQGVAHAKGTVFPGMKGNIYLFAHSTDNFWNIGRYNAVFYLLKDLSFGDEVIIFFENRRHNYVVTDSKIVEAEEVSLLVDSQKVNDERLILQTCWPPGTTWKRLIVLAKPK